MCFDKKAFGARLKEAREKARLTQEELAGICDISATHVRNMERGERRPKLDLVVRLCNATGFSPNYLLQDSLGNTELDELLASMEHYAGLDANQVRQVSSIVAEVVRTFFVADGDAAKD